MVGIWLGSEEMRVDVSKDASTKLDTIRVFYNSACPVCNAGIKSQQRKSSDTLVEYEDVHLDNQLVEHVNASLAFVRERLHVVDENQQIHIGMDGCVYLYLAPFPQRTLESQTVQRARYTCSGGCWL